MIIRARRSGWVEAAILIAILGAAAWLRWIYLYGSSIYIDEYITLRAAKQILARGVPLLPSGNFYSHGLILSYIEAAILRLAGFNPLLARLPALLFGLLTVLLTWWVGRRWFSSVVGLLAAAILVLNPDAILWSARARMYAPLQLFVLLAVFFFWRGLRRGSRGDSALFALCFVGALFSHAEAMALLPAFALVALVASLPELRRDGPVAVLRRWWTTGLIAAGLVAGLAVLVELWLRRLGPPMMSLLGEGTYGPSSRVYVRVAWDWPGIRKTLEPLFLSPVILALLALLAIGVVYWLVRRRQGTEFHLPEGWGPTLAYLVGIWLAVLPVLLFVTDASWRNPRYLFMLLPELFLALAAGLFAVWGVTSSERRRSWVLLGVALAIVLVGSWPDAWAALHEEVAGYDRAFEYLATQRQPGDAVMTFVPQAAVLHLGSVDYLSVPTDFRGFAYQQEGRWLEGWDCIPMVDSPAGIAQALAAHQRLWFVVDEHRFHQRFPPEFVQAVWDGMDLVWRDHEVMIFRTAEPSPPSERRDVGVELGGQIKLAGYALEAEPYPGSSLPLTLYWTATTRPQGLYSAFVHLVDADSTGWAQDDGPPVGQVYPTAYWSPGETMRGRRNLFLPAELPPGLYRLEAGLYDPETMVHLTTPDGRDRVTLGFLRVGQPEPAPSDLVPVDSVFAQQIRLLGYTLSQTGDRTWALTLAWAPETSVDGDYTVFVHLVDAAGRIWGQHDGPPGGGFYPTSFWSLGETVLDRHDISLNSDAPDGTYYLQVGLYRPESGERLPTPTGDYVELASWSIP